MTLTSEDEAFIAAINAAPDDQTVKLVYADWLTEHDYPDLAACYRDRTRMEEEEFRASIVARGDTPEPYGHNSGYVALVFMRNGREIAAIAVFSHCSCFGIWDSVCDGSAETPHFIWIGPVASLVDMANRLLDPVIPTRTILAEDCNAEQLRALYMQVRIWARDRHLGHPSFA